VRIREAGAWGHDATNPWSKQWPEATRPASRRELLPYDALRAPPDQETSGKQHRQHADGRRGPRGVKGIAEQSILHASSIRAEGCATMATTTTAIIGGSERTHERTDGAREPDREVAMVFWEPDGDAVR